MRRFGRQLFPSDRQNKNTSCECVKFPGQDARSFKLPTISSSRSAGLSSTKERAYVEKSQVVSVIIKSLQILASKGKWTLRLARKLKRHGSINAATKQVYLASHVSPNEVQA